MTRTFRYRLFPRRGKKKALDFINQRLDFWHKLTRKMANTYGLIALEDLNLNFMRKNPYLALSASDAGLGMFQQLLGYKAEEAGCQIVVVNPRNTSQECNRCGVLVPKSLSVRVHHCSFCGLLEDRDVNAARNILHLGLSPPGRGGRTST